MSIRTVFSLPTLPSLSLTRSFRRSHGRLLWVTAALIGAAMTSQTATAQGIVFTPPIQTFAGTGAPAFSGDGGQATAAGLNAPEGLAFDNNGNVYIADYNNNRIRVVNPAGVISTISGGAQCPNPTATTGACGDGGAFSAATYYNPTQMQFDAAGNLYIADYSDNRIRKVTATNGLITGASIITTVAGNGSQAESGNGGQATAAGLYLPHGIVVDSAGNLYILDQVGCTVRKVTASTGVISLFAGNGTCGYAGDGGQANATGAEIRYGVNLALDASGNLYIADRGNNVVRKVTISTNVISTIAGTNGTACNPTTATCGDGGAATSADLSGPAGLEFDSFGDLIIADADGSRIRKVTATNGVITGSSIISTVAGTGAACNTNGTTSGTCGDGGPAVSATFSFPIQVSIDKQDRIFFTDQYANRVRFYSPPFYFPATEVGAASPSQNVLLTTTGTGTTTISSITVPNDAKGTPEFIVGTLSSGCSFNMAIASGTLCTVPVTFNPAYTGLQTEPLVVVTTTGTYQLGLSGIGLAPLATFSPGTLSTVAGTGAATSTTASAGNGGAATLATFNSPRSITFDYAGNYYIGDLNNNEIREVNTAGNISIFAGGGTTNYVTNPGGLATAAQLNTPVQVVFDAAGNGYIADYNNYVVARVDAVTKDITVAAGNGTRGYTGDGGLATSAELEGPTQLAIDPTTDNLYIEDSQANVIRVVNLNSGIINTVAGTGTACSSATATCGDGGQATAAQFNAPNGLFLDPFANIYIGDTNNNRIREINGSTGIITTIAGTGAAGYSGDGAAATSAKLNAPLQVTVDAAGDVYFADRGNSAVRVITASTGIISTVVGNGTACTTVPSPACGDGGPANVSALSAPGGVAVDTGGNIFVVENGTNRVRKVTGSPASLLFPSTVVGSTMGPLYATLYDIGNQTLTIVPPSSGTNPSVSANFAISSASTTCPQLTSASTAGSLASGANCLFALNFAPTMAGTNTGTLVETDNSLNATNATQTVNLKGTATMEVPMIAETSSVNPSTYGGSTTLTATVTGGGVTPTGTVTFTYVSGGTTYTLGTGTLNSSGVATLATTALLAGSDVVTASYGGDTNYSTASTTVTQTVNKAPTTDTLGTSNASPAYGSSVTLTYTLPPVTGAALTPTGTVTFTTVSGGNTITLGTGTVSTTNGVTTAKLVTTALPVGSDTVTGTYSGDPNYLTETATVAETVSKAPSTDTLTTSNATPAFGSSVTLTYTVPAVNGVYPTGTVTFTYVSGGNTVTLGTGTLNASGVATLTTSALPVGSETVTGSYGGDTNYLAETQTVAETVSKATTTDTLTTSNAAPTYGSSVTLTYTAPAAASGVYPTGTVTFTYVSGGSTITLGTGTLNASGVATLTTTALPVGSETVTGSYGGDTNYNAGTATVGETVAKATPTIGETSSVNPSTYGQSTTLTATVTGAGTTPTGTVTFTYVSGGNTVTLGTGTLNGSGVATLATTALPTGSEVVTATYNGSTSYNTTSTTVTQTVNKVATTDTLGTSNATPNYGSPVTLTYTVPAVTGAASPATGTVTFTYVSSGNTITLGTGTLSTTGGVTTATLTTSALPTGSVTVTGSYGGDTNYLAETATVAETVKQVASSTNSTISPASATVVAGSQQTLTVTVNDSTTSPGQPISGAAVSFTSNSSTAVFSAAAPTNASGVTTVTITDTVAETVTVTATVTPSGGSAVAIATQPAITFVAPAYVVTVLNDPSPVNPSACVDPNISTSGNTGCSLRDAVAAADLLSGVNTQITLPTTGTITLTQSTAIPITAPVTISGPGANALTISGGGNVPIFSVAAGPSTITGVTLQNGSGGTTGGGAVDVTAGALTLNADGINGNAGSGPGGAVLNSGPGTLTVSNTSFASNVSTGGNGGAIANTGGGKMVVYNSTFYRDLAPGGNGGAIANNGPLTATNNTFSTDSAVSGGAIYEATGATATTALNIFTADTATNAGAGVYGNGTTYNASKTIYYQNTTNGTEDDCNSCTTNTTPISANPLLAPIGNYGGTTQTMLPLPGSSAICSGSAPTLITPAFTSDERGVAFGAENGTTGCYPIGAVETNYSISFTTQPSNTVAAATMTPAPVVTVVENGIPLVGGSATLPVTDADTDITAGSTTSATSSTAGATAGQAAYNNLAFTNLETGDTLTSTLSLNPALATPLSLSATSGTFNITAQVNTITFPPLANTPLGSPAPTPMATSTAGGTITYASTTPSVCTVSGSTITDIAVGTCTITANQAATGSYAAAAQVSQSYQVTSAATTDTLTTSNAAPTFGSAVTLTFTVPKATGATAYATGTVTFTYVSGGNTVTLGTGTLNASGVATLTTSALPVGAETVTGSYAGDTNYAAGTATVNETVGKTTSTDTVTTSNASPTFGSSVTLTYTAPPVNGVYPTGTVTFTTVSGGQTITLGTGTLNASGVATLTTSALPTGSDTVTGSYSGDTNFAAATATVAETVGKTTSTDILTTSNASPTFGSSVTLTYTAPAVNGVYPTGTVTFTTVSGGQTITLGTGTLNASGVATLTTSSLPTGSDTVTGSYAGDSNFAAATATVAETVGKATSTNTLTTSNASPTFGSSVTLTYTAPAVNGVYPTGTVTFTTVSGGQTITLGTGTLNASGVATLTTSALPTGSDTVTGSYPGDTNFAATTATVAETVGKTTSTDTLTTSNASPTFGSSVTLTYTAPAVNGVYPTGTVTFTTVSGGQTITLGTGTLNTSGVATLTTSALPTGSDTVTGSYPGDTNFASTTATVAETVGKSATADTLTTSNATPTAGTSVTLTYTVPVVNGVQPTGTVTLTTVSNGTTITLGSGTPNASGVVTVMTTALPVGSDTVTGSYPGDSNYAAGTATVSETVGAASSANDTVTATPTNPTAGTSVTLTFTVPLVNGVVPTGSVTFTSGGQTFGPVTVNSSGVATVTTTTLPVGSDTITAAYTGDSNYAAGSPTTTVTVGPAASSSDTVTATPSSTTAGTTVTLTFQVPVVNGKAPTGSVTFTSGGQTFGPATVSSTGVATVTTSTLPVGTDTVTAAYTGDANYAAGSPTTTVTVGPASAASDTVTVSPTNPTLGQSTTLTFTVPLVNGKAPTGSVTFTIGGQTFGPVTVNSSGVATFTTTMLPGGTNTLTANYTGDSNYAAGSPTTTVTVGPAPSTNDTLTTSNATPSFGSSVTLTFTVPLVNGVAPTGTVTFFNGTTAIGTGAINSSGVATLTTNALPTGTDNIKATYPGDTNYAAGSATLTETVGTASGADTLTSSNLSPAAGTPVTLTFTVPVVGGTAPTGTVSFYNGTTLLGTGTINSSGVATLTTSTLPVGSDTVKATYPGDTNYAAGSATVTETVGTAPSTNDTLTASPTNPTAGTSVTLTFTVPLVNGVAPTGTVSFYNGTTLLGTGTIGANGVATLMTSALPAGTDTVKATYPGDSNYSAASLTTSVTVGPASSANDTLTTTNATPTFGTPVTLTFTVPLVNGAVPTGTVSFYNGTTLLGTGNISASGVATLTTSALPVGTDSVKASFPGDNNYAAGTATLTETVSSASSGGDTLTASPTAPTAGTPVTLTFSVPLVNGIAPTGTVSFYNGTTLLGTATIGSNGVSTFTTSALPAGTDSVKATYPGDSNYAAGSATTSVTVGPAASTNDTLTTSNATPSAGTPVTLTFTVPLVNGVAPTGTVTFSNGSTTLGTATIGTNGIATLTTSALPVGSDTVKATYAGDANYATGSATVAETVSAASSTGDTLSASPASTTAGNPVTLTFTVPLVNGVAPTGTVSFYNGTTLLGTATIGANGVATFTTSALPAGTDTLKATYPGDSNYAAGSATSSVTVGPASSANDTLTTSNAAPAFGSSVTLTFTVPLVNGVAPTGTVSFYNGTTLLGSGTINASGVATLMTTALPVGSDTVKGSYAGDANYASGSATVGETVGVASTTDTLSANPTAPTAGAPVTLTFTVPLVNGVAPTGTVSFYNGTTLLGTATIGANGVATLITSALPVGSDQIKATYPGDSNYGAGSATTTVTVGPAASTNDTLTTSNATPAFGASVTLTFNVPLVNGVAPTGTVSFYNGTTLLGTAAINAAGNAVLSTTALPVGSDAVKATYPGDTNYAAGTASVTETVATAAGTDTISANPASTTAGTPVTLTFTVPLVNGVAPTGSVSFYNGTTLLGTATIGANGVATFITSALPVGTDTVKGNYTGDSNYAAGTATTSVTVGPAASTNDTLTTSNATPTFGSAVTLTFTVPLVNGVAPTGTVSFFNGTTLLGTATIGANGVATFTTSALPGGSDAVKATYPGDANYAAGSATLTETVGTASSTDTLTTSNATPTVGTAVTLTYTAPAVNGVYPTGTVTFTTVSGGVTITLGTGTLNAAGVATLTTNALPVGSDTVTGSYSGDSNFAANSATVAETVGKANSTDTLTTSNATPGFGTAVTLTFTVPPVNGVYATGTVTFTTVSGGVTITLGTGTLNAQGVATLTTSALPAGSDTVTGSYPGDTNFNTSSATVGETVGKAAPTNALTTSNATPAFGSSVTLNYTVPAVNGVYPTGTITFTTVSGGVTITLGTGTLNAQGVATLITTALPAGSDTVTGTYPGDINFAASSATVAETVGAAPSTNDTLTANPTTTTEGSSVTLTFTVPLVNGVAPTGTVSFYNGTTLLGTATIGANGIATINTTALPAGTDTVTANYAGDSHYATASLTTTVTVNPAASTNDTLMTSNATPVFGTSVTFTFTVPLVNGIAPTGSVSFFNGTTLLGTGTVNASGVATLSTTALPTGSDTVKAVYAGDTNYATATLTVLETVSTVAATNDTLTENPTTSVLGTPVTFTFTVPSVNGTPATGTVIFTYGTTVLGTATLNASGVATLITSVLPVGSDTVKATYAGDTNYATGSLSVIETVTVADGTPGSQTLTSSTSTSFIGQPVTFTYTVTLVNGIAPTGTVSFYNGTTLLGTATIGANGVATLTTSALPAGSDTVTAKYTGDGNYAAGTASVVHVVSSQDFTITASAPQTINPGQTVVYNVSLAGFSGSAFTLPVTLTATGLPADATVAFGSPTLTPGVGPTSTTMTIMTSPNHSMLHPMGGGSGIFYGLLLLPLLGVRSVRRKLRALPRGVTLALASLLLLGGLTTLTGCGGGYFGPQPHTYTITVTGTSGTLSHSTTVTLTIE